MSRMLILVAALVLVIGAGNVARAADDTALIVMESTADFDTTVQRLQDEIESRGATVVATVDHAAAAKANDLQLRPTTVIIFGNPALGTPLMQSRQTTGIDLPLRVLVWEDDGGTVRIAYWPPSRITQAHDAENVGEVTDRMTAALDAITSTAAGR